VDIVTGLPGSRERRFPSGASSTSGARAFVGEVLRLAEVDRQTISEFELIVSELVANAVQHGDGGDVVVRLDASDADWLVLTIVSGISATTPPLDPASWTVAGALQPSGRGLGIVKELAQEIDIVRDGDFLVIVCRRRR
jgi:anti-sigma regulatory factor (Ser/Thr protein kinase)